ncbi:DedA family protein [Peribacillus loiseleuriae]|uniref:DedA family protein n=1 Tax=Peribacillus loiseleuriae TaxID=1679170 RepID=UPI0037FB59F0
MMQHLMYLLGHFGYFGIIIALMGGIIGLPIPDEILLTYLGYLVYKGQLSYIVSLVSAVVGATAGISISYLLGIKLGLPFLRKYGPKIHLTEKGINKTKILFLKFGPFLLFIGYFIPGVRHVTAYLAGINGLSYKKFAVYAYSGALLWCFTFITIGTKLGKEWKKVGFYLSKYSLNVIVFVVVLSLIIAFVYWRKTKYNGKVM